MISFNRFFTCWEITSWNGRASLIIHRPINCWKRSFTNFNTPWYRRIPWKLIEIERHW